jgi:AraC-like DNA-binding protein
MHVSCFILRSPQAEAGRSIPNARSTLIITHPHRPRRVPAATPAGFRTVSIRVPRWKRLLHRRARRILAHVGPAVAAVIPGLTGRLRHILRPRLVLGDANMPEVAAHLGLHPRTLRRHLAREGLTFEEVKDEVRYATARELLEITDLPVGDVAAALSFSTPSAFVHAFRRCSGTTPTAWRAAHGGASPHRNDDAGM